MSSGGKIIAALNQQFINTLWHLFVREMSQYLQHPEPPQTQPAQLVGRSLELTAINFLAKCKMVNSIEFDCAELGGRLATGAEVTRRRSFLKSTGNGNTFGWEDTLKYWLQMV